MKILVVGSGGREDAIVWKISQSPKADKIYAAPGNGGMARRAELIDIRTEDIEALADFARLEGIDLTVVGPESPLVSGIVDLFVSRGLRVFGPSKELARLEGSKIFSKETMKKFGVPTADFKIFTEPGPARAHIENISMPCVVKADGLCAGKGVVVAKTKKEALDAVSDMMEKRIFGSAGEKVIIEDCLEGEEASIIIIVDGKNFVSLASSQDHKRVYDGDRGPNTGGMGAYSPAPVVTDELYKRIEDEIIRPMLNGFSKEGKSYKGVLYIGVMVTKAGPKVLEFNVRFGDPETQAILPRLKTDLVEIMEKAISGDLRGLNLEWDARPCVSVVASSGGYPGHYEKGKEIAGLQDADKIKDVVVFHAGTKKGQRSQNGSSLYITTGGRVLAVSALGEDIKEAIDNCYKAMARIRFDGIHYRKDIAFRALKR